MSLVNESQQATLNNLFLTKLGRTPTAAEMASAQTMVATHSWDDIGSRISGMASQSFAAAPEFGDFWGGLGGAIKGAATGLVTGGVTGMVAGGVKGAVTGSRGGPPSVPMPGAGTNSLTLPGVGTLTKIGTGVGIAGGIAGLIPGATSACGCNGSNGRDPCTHQKMSAQRAPEASFFGGCCPPGRVLRRRPWARDICAKKSKMNVFNPQALARADRRVTGFARRAAPILRDLGFQVSTSTRKPKGLKVGKRRRR